MNLVRGVGAVVTLAGLSIAMTGCPRCDQAHLPVYEEEPKVDAELPPPDPGEIGQDSPSVKGTITLGQGGGVLLDFVLDNQDPKYKLDKVFVYAGNYQQPDASDVPEYPNPPTGSTWVATQTLDRVPGPNTQTVSVFAPPGHLVPYDPLDADSQRVWAFLSVYLIHEEGQTMVRHRQFYRLWRDTVTGVTPVDPEYFRVVPGLAGNAVDKSGPPHTW